MTRSLPDLLRNRIATDAPRAICVGFSGGPDSTALLHALAQLPEARALGLRALHVDHGLHPGSTTWARRCREFCDALDVPVGVHHVTVDRSRGEGMEAAARRARYGAFTAHLRPGEWLALAHHRDDQIETVLLKLLRGAGPEGLAGMRALRPFAAGCLWRPLLDVQRAELLAYLAAQRLDSIDDPANRDPRFARNVIRREVLPLLERHWPHVGASILHSAGLCRTASDRLGIEARSALRSLVRPHRSLDAAGWLALPAGLQGWVIEAWLHDLGLASPTDRARRELARQARNAASDAASRICWPGAEVRVWDRRMFALPPLADPPADWQAEWDGSPLDLPGGCGVLAATPLPGSAATRPIQPPLTVRFRTGGERIQPRGDAHTRELGNLFQRARIAPWIRSRCPLIFRDDELIAVGDRWISARGQAVFDAHGVWPRWTPRPSHLPS